MALRSPLGYRQESFRKSKPIEQPSRWDHLRRSIGDRRALWALLLVAVLVVLGGGRRVFAEVRFLWLAASPFAGDAEALLAIGRIVAPEAEVGVGDPRGGGLVIVIRQPVSSGIGRDLTDHDWMRTYLRQDAEVILAAFVRRSGKRPLGHAVVQFHLPVMRGLDEEDRDVYRVGVEVAAVGRRSKVTAARIREHLQVEEDRFGDLEVAPTGDANL